MGVIFGELRAILGQNERVNGKPLRLMPYPQLEPISKQGLKHRHDFILLFMKRELLPFALGQGVLQLRVDIEHFRLYPVWTSYNLSRAYWKPIVAVRNLDQVY